MPPLTASALSGAVKQDKATARARGVVCHEESFAEEVAGLKRFDRAFRPRQF